MNNLNENDKDTSMRFNKFISSIVAYDAKHGFLAGSYRCPKNDGETVVLHGFMRAATVRSNIQIKLTRRWDHPKPGLINQEVSQICNANNMATIMM